MIAAFLIAAATVVPTPVASIVPETLVQEAAQAVKAGRFDQARLMVGRAVAAGVHGRSVDMVLADSAFAQHNFGEALSRYEALLAADPENSMLLERAGIAALNLGELSRAAPLLVRATNLSGASWRAWNARGVVADWDRDWPAADDAYAHALQLAPNAANVINNRGWSQLMRGNWSEAVNDFERANALDPGSARIRNNLELARSASSANLPRRHEGETDESWAARLNDAGVAAQIFGDKSRAVAAFTQALEASGSWYVRAANNLSATAASK